MADKDYDAMIREILPLAEEFYTVTPDSDRALQASHLADFIRKEELRQQSFQELMR